MDDRLVESLDGEKHDEEFPSQSGIGSLLSYPQKEQNTAQPETVIMESRRRSRFHLFRKETSTSAARYLFGEASREMEKTLTMSENVRIFKGPEHSSEQLSLIHSPNRLEINPLPIIADSNDARRGQTCVTETVTPVQLQNSVEATIKRALQRSSQEPDLIGDYSRPFILPLMQGKHQDLKTISSDTLAKLLEGEFNISVDSFTILDCRYPYEYSAGHIKGALNVYTLDQISKEFIEINKSRPVSTCKRNILIFHCEFSAKRGPNLSRFLRNADRVLNKEIYPALHYPEVYLLHGGYKDFFEWHSDLCEPCAYLPMLDPKHKADLRYFSSEAKVGDNKTCSVYCNMKRLRL